MALVHDLRKMILDHDSHQEVEDKVASIKADAKKLRSELEGVSVK